MPQAEQPGQVACGHFADPTRLAMEIEKKYVVTEAVTTGVGQGASRLAANGALQNVEVGKQIWSSTKSKTSVENSFYHRIKHKEEFPELQNTKQYVEKCWEFLSSNLESTLVKTQPNGEMLRYHPETNIFASYTKDGIPKTMFKPKSGLEYWEAQ